MSRTKEEHDLLLAAMAELVPTIHRVSSRSGKDMDLFSAPEDRRG
jgi:hypothetical protein